MTPYVKGRLTQLDKALKKIADTIQVPLEQHRESLRVLQQCEHDFRKHVDRHGFATPEDEIRFFKHEKPELFAQIIYHKVMVHIESRKAARSRKIKKAIKEELRAIDLFFDRNDVFIDYLDAGETYSDSWYFIRKGEESCCFLPEAEAGWDAASGTGYDMLVARKIAYARLEETLEEQLWQLKLQKRTAITEAPARDNPEPAALKGVILPGQTSRLLKSHQVERLLLISRSTLRKMRNQGTIPFVRIGGIYYYDENEIRRIFEKNKHNEQWKH